MVPKSRTARRSSIGALAAPIIWLWIVCLLSGFNPLWRANSFAAENESVGDDAWYHWRGPQGDGTSGPNANPPVQWSESENVRWRVALPGEGSGTPIVVGNRIFLQLASPTNRKTDEPAEPHPDTKTPIPDTIYEYAVLAIDRVSGEALWKTVVNASAPHEGRHPTNTYASASVTTDGIHLYASFGSKGVYCLTLDGELVWERQLGQMRTRYGWGEGASPLLYGETLVVNWDQEDQSKLFVLDKRTGETRWQAERDEPTTWATPLATSFQGQDQLVVHGTNRVRSYDLQSGEVIWECGGQTVNAIPTPVRSGDTVICLSGYRGSLGVAIPLDSKGDVTGSATLKWIYDDGTPYVPSPLLYEGQLYFTRSNQAILTCLNAETGEVVYGPERLPQIDSLYASPIGASGRIYFVGRNGAAVVLQHGSEMNVLATNRLDDSFDASPVAVDNQLILRGRQFLYCLEQDPQQDSQ